MADEKISYIPGFTVCEYLNHMRAAFPLFFETLRTDMFTEKEFYSLIKQMDNRSCDFESSDKGGRGSTYVVAQHETPSARITGISQLINYVSPGGKLENIQAGYKILDVLGGDGTLSRAFLKSGTLKEVILPSDISGFMAASALRQGLPAIREPADHLLLKNNSFDGCIIAYGTHHLSNEELTGACKEAYRVLKNRGIIVLHDFEENSPVAKWFNEVVHRYSITKHHFSHFTLDQLTDYLYQSGFKNIKCDYLFDPFIFFGNSEENVQSKLIRYVKNMYGLKLSDEKLLDLINRYFRVTISCDRNEYKIEMQREGIVTLGIKL